MTNPIFASLPTTIFTHMSALAVQHNAINLGQGFPDEDGPLAIREVAAKALLEGPNQYPPSRGRIELRNAIAAHAKRFYNLTFNPDTDIVVTSGATEALTASIMGLAGASSEVVLIEPAYDSYPPIVEAVGATIRRMKLAAPHYRLREADLRAAFTPKTKALVINTPLNPIGRVFDREELEIIARVVRDSDANVIADEVYEHLVFDGRPQIPLMTLPGMRDRVVRVGSAGKMFSLTGWKIGWVTGSPKLIDAIAKAHQFITFTTAPGTQLAIAYALEKQIDFTLGLTKTLQGNRDVLSADLAKLGFKVLPSEGTYFLTVDISGLTNETDLAFCERIVREAGVALIPLSPFFHSGKPDSLVRFAFCKKRSVIEGALARLDAYFKKR